jgi:hypothetical protein
MRKTILFCAALIVFSAVSAVAHAQSQNQSGQAPVIQINVTRTIQAVNYMAKGSTRIDFRGTALMPQATGQAKVEAKNGAVLISANFDNLSPAGQFGGAYLTYVLWAITPEGRANNLGQLTLDGSKSKVQVTTRLQTFGLMVTAEPYFAVSFPSDEVVLENFVRPDTKGQVDAVDAKYELLQRSRYKNLNLAPLDEDPNVPLDLLQARNAKRIAQSHDAAKYATDSWTKASDSLARAEDYQTRKQKKAVPAAARDAVQAYEDAITISVKRQDEERQANEREAAAQREAQAKSEQEAEKQRRHEAEQQQAEAEKQKLQADLAAAKEAQARAEAQRAQAEAEKAQAAAQANAQAAQEQAAR